MGLNGNTRGREFGVGTHVQIRDGEYLRNFQAYWSFHNNLVPEQFAYAGRIAVVSQVLHYHGGDELYSLAGIPGVWHAACLRPVERDCAVSDADTFVLLPGLHGNIDLFEEFVTKAPRASRVIKVTLPPLSEYDDLFGAVVSQLPATQFVLIAESFSGPIAMRIAAFAPERVRALVLCNSFITRPVNSCLRWVPWSWVLLHRMPEWFLRYFLVGRHAPQELVASVRAAIAKTPSSVLASRVRAVLSLPATNTPSSIARRVLFLTGTEDRLINISTESVKRLLPQAVVKSIRAPHLLLQAAPEAAWEEISTFLAEAG